MRALRSCMAGSVGAPTLITTTPPLSSDALAQLLAVEVAEDGSVLRIRSCTRGLAPFKQTDLR
jgi:hypothetical protein